MERRNLNSDLRLGLYLGRHATFSGGIGVYVRSLVDHYLDMISEGEINLEALVLYGDISLLSERSQRLFEVGAVDGVGSCELKFRQLACPQSRLFGFFLDQATLFRKFREDGITVLHSLANIAIVTTTLSQLATIHDLFQGWPVVDSEAPAIISNRCKNLFYKMVFKLEAYFLVGVIVDARQTAVEVLKFMPIHKGITPRVIPLGLDQIFVEAANSHNIALDSGDTSDLKPGYVLLNYSTDSRKNLRRSLAAWSKLPAKLRARGLVVLGAEGKEENIRSILSDSFDKDLVYCLPHLVREELPRYLINAGVLLVPTLAEGFGFPAVEALAVGTPVVSGRLECLDQVSSPLVYLCEAKDVNSIGAALMAALGNDKITRIVLPKIRTMREVARETFEETLRCATGVVIKDEEKRERDATINS